MTARATHRARPYSFGLSRDTIEFLLSLEFVVPWQGMARDRVAARESCGGWVCQ
jgi:hypothetical protein